MFLHSGASLHGHEYSNSLPRRSSLARSAFSTPIQRRASTYNTPSPILHRPTVVARPVSEILPRHSEPVVRFQEPEPDTMSEDGRSITYSEGSDATAGGSRRRGRSTRTSTAFHLAHPAPTLTQKQRLLQIRPRLLLQLQRLSADTRPKPAIDVLPSTVVVPRLVKKFPRMFRGKAALGANDVMVVRSEEYDTADDPVVDDADSDEEGLATRDLMAVICQVGVRSGGSQGVAEIVMSDGSVWVATPLPNGLYEFVTTDERGDRITARWVKRTNRRSTIDSLGANEFKFTFSVIDPNSRRHPIMASLTNSTLDIPDVYTSVSSSASRYPPTAPLRGFTDDQSVEEPTPRTTHSIDESMRKLIQVTGIWVYLRQGLSPHFKYDDSGVSTAESSPIQRAVSVGSKIRSLRVTTDLGRISPAGTVSSTPDSTQSFFGSKIRHRVKGSSSSACPIPPDQAGPKRSVSNGSAFMQRATARRNSILPSTVVSENEGEKTLQPLQPAATDNMAGNSTNQAHNQRSLPGLSSTPIDTPTKPQRRTQSVFIAPTIPPDEVDISVPRHSADGKRNFDVSEKAKVNRWKAFKDLFRRSNTTSRGS